MSIQNEQYVVRHEGTQKRSQYSELLYALRTGLLPLSAECLIDGSWCPLPEIEEFRNECEGELARLVQRLDTNYIPVCTLIGALLLVIGNWIQNAHVVSILGNGWSNVVLEGRWWGIFTYVLLHSSKVHFMSNLVLFLFLGWRVEHAIGGIRFLLLLCATMMFSSWGVWYWGDGIQVVGASSLVFALWGAQILIGFLFSLPPRHELRYGWWSLMLLMCIFAVQIGKEGLAHLVHGCSILVGSFLLFSLYRIRVPLWSLCGVLVLGLIFGTTIFDSSILKKERIDGMAVFLPRDFVSHRTGDHIVWFHPFQTSGWLIEGVSVGDEQFEQWWSDRGFVQESSEERCIDNGICMFEKEKQKALIHIVHRGRKIYWVSCIFSKKNQIWKKCCIDWMDRVEAIIPYALEQAKAKFEEVSYSVYYIEGYGEQLENIGRYEEADRVYTQLQNTDWSHRGLQYRARLRTEGLLE